MGFLAATIGNTGEPLRNKPASCLKFFRRPYLTQSLIQTTVVEEMLTQVQACCTGILDPALAEQLTQNIIEKWPRSYAKVWKYLDRTSKGQLAVQLKETQEAIDAAVQRGIDDQNAREFVKQECAWVTQVAASLPSDKEIQSLGDYLNDLDNRFPLKDKLTASARAEARRALENVAKAQLRRSLEPYRLFCKSAFA